VKVGDAGSFPNKTETEQLGRKPLGSNPAIQPKRSSPPSLSRTNA
jgi:hypothetical protein